jgi:hypothetical protein
MKNQKMKKEKENMPAKKIPEQEQDEIGSNSESLEEEKLEKASLDDEEDLLYTHKSENRGSSIQWNSAFCRKTGR